MVISDQEMQRLADDLTAQIEARADAKTKQWFENYLKGAIAYRGAKTPLVTRLVREWRDRNQLKHYSLQEQLSLCTYLIASSFAEDKFAGTLYIQKFLLAKLDYLDLLETCDSLFQQGYFFDWSTTDWFCIRVLDPTIVQHGLAAANIVADGRFSENLWRRRAAIVPFRHASDDPKYHDLIETIIADLLPSEERFIQTGIGWVLADFSKSHPRKAETLFRQHIDQLSKEVIDRHTKHLACQASLKALKRRALKQQVFIE